MRDSMAFNKSPLSIRHIKMWIQFGCCFCFHLGFFYTLRLYLFYQKLLFAMYSVGHSIDIPSETFHGMCHCVCLFSTLIVVDIPRGCQYIGNCCHATAPNQIFLSWITCDSANCCMFSLLLLQYILNFIGWSRAKIKIMHSNHVKQNETEWMSIIQLRKWYKKEQHRCMLRNSGKAHWFIALHHQPFLFRAYERFDSAQAQHNVYCSRNACNKDKKT